ncbi:MAG: nitroreductase family deazaflavin-dependent oxidoreductase [Acidimicrobiia bacterium]
MASSRLEKAGSPTGLRRFGFRAPIGLYRAHLGFLLGHRFLMLEHRGRKTDKTRRTVLEVVANRPDALHVAAAWREKADWFQNIEADPSVVVHCGLERFETNAEIMAPEHARQVLSDYASENPRIFTRLARFMLDDPGQTIAENVDRVASTVPVVRLARPD